MTTLAKGTLTSRAMVEAILCSGSWSQRPICAGIGLYLHPPCELFLDTLHMLGAYSYWVYLLILMTYWTLNPILPDSFGSDSDESALYILLR